MFVTLLTDFGAADYFVGAMKGAILSVNPQARIVDITHEIPPQDIQAGAFTLLAAYRSFPAQTIHVAVVDPGVGSNRRPLLVHGGGYFFVGPDNGIFSYVYEREEDCHVFHLNREEFFQKPVSNTFHGRDVFAPIAGALSNGLKPAALGHEITDYARLKTFAPQRSSDGTLNATIIHIDRFGNCITSLTRDHVTDEMILSGMRLQVCGVEITSFRRFYAEAGDAEDSLFAIWGSAGLLEIAAFNDSAARRLKAQRGQAVRVLPDRVAQTKSPGQNPKQQETHGGFEQDGQDRQDQN